MGGRRRRTRIIGAVLAAAALVAACSSGSGVTTESSDTIVADDTSVVPTATDPTDDVDDPQSNDDGEAVDLPSLSPLDPATLTGTLDNGLRYLIRDNDNPGGKAELRLAVDAGSVLEDESQLGGAHFLEHMLFNGTERFPENELVDVLRSFGAGFGADINARTSYDETVYMLTVPNDDDIVETGLDVLEDWLSSATIDPADVDAERGVVLDEWRSRSQTSDGRITQEFSDFILDGSAYDDRSPIGGSEAIETITAEDLRRFYDDWYTPENTTVIVVGDIDPENVESWVIERFSDAEPQGTDPERPDVAVEPVDVARVDVVDDPELAEGALSVTLPWMDPTLDPDEVELAEQRSILDSLAFDIIATRLDNDALRDEASFERAGVASASLVRGLDAPGIQVDVDGAEVEASIQAIVDEFERVARFGFTQAELDRAIATRRRSADRLLDGSGSRQDVSYADEYVRHALEGEWYVEAEREFDFITAVLDAATPESVAQVHSDRYENAGAQAFVSVRSDELEDVVPTEQLVAIFDDAADRDIEPRPDEAGIGDELVARPEPIDEVDSFALADDPTPFQNPTVLEFDNGVTIAFNPTTIVEGQVYFEARSPGGLAAVADDDVAVAQALGTVMADSGAGAFDRVDLDNFLDDKDVAFQASVDPFTDAMAGTAATRDLETLLQFVHLMMTDPTADESAVERFVDDQLPLAQNPSIDVGYAQLDALLDARYDDPRYLLPTPETLETIDAEGIERVATERFGSADDWAFTFSGDFDAEEAMDLARSYLGSLPTSSSSDELDFTEELPPDGAVEVDVAAGQGDAANVAWLYTSEATANRRDDVLAQVVQEVVGNRLTDFIREELGDSYSPAVSIDVGGGSSPAVETYLSVSTAPELTDEVSAAVLDQLDSLRADGPSEREVDNALATVGERLSFISNAQINDEILGVLVDPDGNESFEDFIYQAVLVGDISDDDVRDAMAEWISDTDYIEVTVASGS
ncbi:M16 family metallopeptidase [Ilumatobacter sp.]|uniref:M16 family metallopeptidase n=1 Tax=Ilumatobacter sp. TaxID=1967498 RepID=UPI003C3E2DE7